MNIRILDIAKRRIQSTARKWPKCECKVDMKVHSIAKSDKADHILIYLTCSKKAFACEYVHEYSVVVYGQDKIYLDQYLEI